EVVTGISNTFPFVTFCVSLGTVAVVGVGGVQIFHGRLTLGELIAFNSYLGFLLMPIMTIGFLAAQISRAGASALRVFELLDAALEVADAAGAIPLPTVQGGVEFRDVRFRYAGSERAILKGVTFIVAPGPMVALR